MIQSLVITAALVVLAAFMNAVMDTLAFHRPVSIWRNSSDFWTVDKGPFLPGTKYRWNAWHLAKSAEIIALVAVWPWYVPVVNAWLDVLIAGVLWNLTFNLFFNRVLKSK